MIEPEMPRLRGIPQVLSNNSSAPMLLKTDLGVFPVREAPFVWFGKISKPQGDLRRQPALKTFGDKPQDEGFWS